MKPGPKPRPRTLCAIPGCGKPDSKRLLCENHYYRLKAYGDPLGGRPVDNGRRQAFIDAALVSDTDECIDWPFRLSENGYPIVNKKRVHRMVCKKGNGPIATHSCDNKRCINPKHVGWGTYGSNLQDAWARGLRQ